MPIFNTKQQDYKAPRDAEFSWENFRAGLNTLLRETELKDNELSRADNILLVGSGIPTKCWGTANYFQSAATGSVRGLFGYYNGATNELLAITDEGYLNKKNGSSYTAIIGASWASGYNAEMVQLNNNTYIVNGNDIFYKYDGSALSSFATIDPPTAGLITNLSGSSGIGPQTTASFRISAESQVGETLANCRVSLASVQEDFTNALLRISWTGTSAASGVLKGYVIYGTEFGNETYISRVGKDTLSYDYAGSPLPSLIVEPPTADSTGGPIAKYIIKYKDKLVMAGISGALTRVLWSGGGQNLEKFHWSQGGGWIDIDKDSGDNITGIAVHQEKLIVFKEKSIWQLTLSVSGSLVVPTSNLITSSHGCSAHRTIQAVENDLMFLSRDGTYVLGYEPNILNVIRTNEVSAKIRPTLAGITASDYLNASAMYMDHKYFLTFPTSRKTLVYDREKMAWLGPLNKPIGYNGFLTYFDSSNNRHYLSQDAEDPYVTEWNEDFSDDKGTTIETNLRTKWEDFKTWHLYKTLKDIFTNFKNASGTVTVNIRIINRDGNTETIKSFTITSPTSQISAGMGTDMLGSVMMGDTEGAGTEQTTTDVIRWSNLNKTARAVQVEVITNTGSTDNYELLGIRGSGRPQGKGSLPASWRT